MAGTNFSSQFSADVEAYIANETLPLAQKMLVSFQFGDPLTLPKGRGVTYQAARWNRVPLPFAALSEGVPPVGQTMTVTMVSATALQWGDKITLTDVTELTIKHPVFNIAKELCTLSVAETLERNTFNNLMGGTQINYVNSRGSRAALVAGDVLNAHEINRAFGALQTGGAWMFMGPNETDVKQKADAGGVSGQRASDNPAGMPHYTAIIHTLAAQDLRENATVLLAWSYSDINRLYNYEIGELGGVRFCTSNMVPTFTGFAVVTATAATTGSLAGGTYGVQVTGQDTQNQYESYIATIQTGLAVTGPNGSITLTTPNVAGYTFNVYIGTSPNVTNLGLSTAGPTSGPLTGQATQLPPNTAVTITGLGLAQTPPAYPGNTTGITVYPTYVFGRGAYGQVMLDEIKYTYLDTADKSDPLNQLRVVGWKVMYGTILLNQLFFMRIESTSAFAATYG